MSLYADIFWNYSFQIMWSPNRWFVVFIKLDSCSNGSSTLHYLSFESSMTYLKKQSLHVCPLDVSLESSPSSVWHGYVHGKLSSVFDFANYSMRVCRAYFPYFRSAIVQDELFWTLHRSNIMTAEEEVVKLKSELVSTDLYMILFSPRFPSHDAIVVRMTWIFLRSQKERGS